jgi:predicted outer membrane repeat protein
MPTRESKGVTAMDHRRFVTCFVVGVVVATTSSAVQAQTVLYVDDDGPVGGDGLSWSTSYRFLQDALLAAEVIGIFDEIRVAQGTYLPDRNEGIPGGSGARDATFNLSNQVSLSIMGGYAGIGAPDPDARDIDAYPTILSGDLLGNDGPNFANNDENSFRVVSSWYLDSTVVLDGFTITASNNDRSYPDSRGGGMYNEDSSPTIANCSFVSNHADAAAGMYNNLGSPTLTDCSFIGNLAIVGGGLYNTWGSPALTDCSFIGNSSADGAGMVSHLGSPTLTGCSFIGNDCEAGEPQEGGGALYIYSTDSSVTVTDCTFSENSCSQASGGIVLEGGSQTVIDCSFNGNSGVRGVGMYVKNGSPTVTNCSFDGNTETSTWGGGGGIHVRAGSTTVAGCTFSENSADQSNGGGIYVDPSATLSLTDSDFCGNTPDHIEGQVDLIGDLQMLAVCPVPVCPGDVNGDGEVGVNDFLVLLAVWGACP